MATAVSDQVLTLTGGYQAAQARRAAAIAALVAYYYRTKVNISDASSVEAWLKLLVPRITAEYGKAAGLAVQYGDALRRLEVPGAPPFKFAPAAPLDAEAVRTSLMVLGVKNLESKMSFIRDLDEQTYDAQDKQAMFEDAARTAATAVAGATKRHVLNGGRQTIYDNTARDKTALGWVRVTDGDPCYFCAMLTSRGVVYGQDSFDESNARFTGDGHVKVHDHCGCGLKPVYTRKGDPYVDQAEEYAKLWAEYSTESGKAAIKSFRQGYEGRTG